MNLPLFSRVTCLMLVAITYCYAEDELATLDQNVFKSLEKTKLKDLTGNYSNYIVNMIYTLNGNTIDEVSAESGIFNMDVGLLLAQLPKTKGTLSGVYQASIEAALLRKKSFGIILRVEGNYTAKIDDVDLQITISLPKSPTEQMGLVRCFANVSKLELDLTAKDRRDKAMIVNLKEWLMDVMKPSFSDLFCDTMQRILDEGMRSPVVQALYNRMRTLMTGATTPTHSKDRLES